MEWNPVGVHPFTKGTTGRLAHMHKFQSLSRFLIKFRFSFVPLRCTVLAFEGLRPYLVPLDLKCHGWHRAKAGYRAWSPMC